MKTNIVIQIIVRALMMMEVFLMIVIATTSNLVLQAALEMGKVNNDTQVVVH
jgi:hypothetical protein